MIDYFEKYIKYKKKYYDLKAGSEKSSPDDGIKKPASTPGDKDPASLTDDEIWTNYNNFIDGLWMIQKNRDSSKKSSIESTRAMEDCVEELNKIVIVNYSKPGQGKAIYIRHKADEYSQLQSNESKDYEYGLSFHKKNDIDSDKSFFIANTLHVKTPPSITISQSCLKKRSQQGYFIVYDLKFEREKFVFSPKPWKSDCNENELKNFIAKEPLNVFSEAIGIFEYYFNEYYLNIKKEEKVSEKRSAEKENKEQILERNIDSFVNFIGCKAISTGNNLYKLILEPFFGNNIVINKDRIILDGSFIRLEDLNESHIKYPNDCNDFDLGKIELSRDNKVNIFIDKFKNIVKYKTGYNIGILKGKKIVLENKYKNYYFKYFKENNKILFFIDPECYKEYMEKVFPDKKILSKQMDRSKKEKRMQDRKIIENKIKFKKEGKLFGINEIFQELSEFEKFKSIGNYFSLDYPKNEIKGGTNTSSDYDEEDWENVDWENIDLTNLPKGEEKDAIGKEKVVSELKESEGLEKDIRVIRMDYFYTKLYNLSDIEFLNLTDINGKYNDGTLNYYINEYNKFIIEAEQLLRLLNIGFYLQLNDI